MVWYYHNSEDISTKETSTSSRKSVRKWAHTVPKKREKPEWYREAEHRGQGGIFPLIEVWGKGDNHFNFFTSISSGMRLKLIKIVSALICRNQIDLLVWSKLRLSHSGHEKRSKNCLLSWLHQGNLWSGLIFDKQTTYFRCAPMPKDWFYSWGDTDMSLREWW